jgi:hypothetical protein
MQTRWSTAEGADAFRPGDRRLGRRHGRASKAVVSADVFMERPLNHAMRINQ